jgi:hypothetical protein
MVKTMVSFRFSMDNGKQMARKPILKSPINHHEIPMKSPFFWIK